jgi:hypothetical protein
MIENYKPAVEEVKVGPKYDLSKERVLAEIKQNCDGDTIFHLRLLDTKSTQRLGKLYIIINVRERMVCE